MKRKSEPETNNEFLEEVSFEQAQNLKKIGFDWKCDKAYNINGEEVNWTTKHFHCWKPTIALALKFMRKRFGIYNEMYIRSWDENLFGFNVAHGLNSIDICSCSLLEKGDEEEDGITSFDFDEAENRALNYTIRYILKTFEKDYSWLKPGKKVYKNSYGIKPDIKTCEVIEFDEAKRVVKIDDDGDEYWIYVHKIHKTHKDALKEYEEVIEVKKI